MTFRIFTVVAWSVWAVATAGPASATTYYIRGDGSAPSKAFATGCLSAETAMNPDTHNVEVFEPGDTIVLCNEGGDIRSAIYPTSSGLEDAPIVYDGLGTAVLSGSNLVSGWVVDEGSIYRAAVGIEPRQVFVDGTFGDRKGSRGELVNDLDWYWEPDILYLYSSAGDPDGAYQDPGVEAGARDECFGPSTDHLVVTGMTFRHANWSGLKAWNPGSHITITKCVAEWNWQVGIDLNGEHAYHDAVVENNVARFNGTGGIGLQGPAKNSVVRSNECYSNGTFQSAGNDFEEQHQWTYGIKLWEYFPAQEGNDIYFNEIHHNGRIQENDYQGRGVGLWLDGIAGNPNNPVVVRHNLVYSNKGNGLFLEISDNTAVFGNILHNNASNTAGDDEFTAANIVIDARGSWSSDHNMVVNNTSYGGRVGIKIATYDCEGCSVSGNVVKNNIVIAAAEHNLYANYGGDNDGTRGSGNAYVNNNFGQESATFINWGGINYGSYADWKAIYGGPTNSISGDPLLAGDEPTTLYLTPESPCRDTGANLGPNFAGGLLQSSVWTESVDVADQNRHGAGWDVGAYVFFSFTRRADPDARQAPNSKNQVSKTQNGRQTD